MTASERDPEDERAPSEAAGGGDPPRQAGVLGNLPKKRPAVRSPRRTRARTGPETQPAAEQAPPEDRKARPTRPRSEPADQSPEPSEHSHAADLEGLARGGIAIAGGAASLGLRIAGRAAAALRDAVERR
ncbi:MAG: hypothetical protein KDB46_04560 [Solirubrobacterales bacterium]|nr:hypothetical protein [Solirubrobacterales bacterium]